MKPQEARGASVTLDDFTLYAELVSQIRSCEKCALSRNRKNAVPGEGNLRSQIMFVGEGPGAEEDLQGRPFVGQAGKLLDQMLASIGLERKEVYITNIVKCRPPGNRDPLPQEIEACYPYLSAQIGIICPQVICTLGRHALHTLLGQEYSISSVHGKLFENKGIRYFPTYHPAAALYQEGIKAELLKDFQQLKEILKEIK